MRVPDRQPQRALVVLLGYLAVGGPGTLVLVLLLGGLLAALLAAGLTVCP